MKFVDGLPHNATLQLLNQPKPEVPMHPAQADQLRNTQSGIARAQQLAPTQPETLSVVHEHTLKQLEELEIILEQIKTAMTGPRVAGEGKDPRGSGGLFSTATEIRARVYALVCLAQGIRDGL